MMESGMYVLGEDELREKDRGSNEVPVEVLSNEAVEQASIAAQDYADKVANQLSKAFEIYPLTRTWGISNRHIKNAFSVVGALALLNVARKNKLITAGLIGAGYIYATNVQKVPMNPKETLKNMA